MYATRLRTDSAEDYVPFFVRPKKGTATARVAFLVPTFSYLAYGGTGNSGFNTLSNYAHHTDGSGIGYSSRLRPITNMRPKITTRNPWQFMEDTYIVDWLDVKGLAADIITDQDLHFEGAALLAPYKVVLTGSHPEYDSQQMLDGLHQYLNRADGGPTVALTQGLRYDGKPVPTVLRERGFEVRIYTLDHPPSHVHVAKAGAIVKIDLTTHQATEIVGSISDHGVKVAERLVAQNATLLREHWEKIHGRRHIKRKRS